MPYQDHVKLTFLGHVDNNLGRVTTAQQGL